MKVSKMLARTTILALTVVGLGACGGDDSVPPPPPPSGQDFVTALNGVSSNTVSTVKKPDSLSPGYFVFFDARINQNVAISLTDIQAFVAADLVDQKPMEMAALQYRMNSLNGLPLFGSETVSQLGYDMQNRPMYVGDVTGFLYEDEGATKDVELMNAMQAESNLLAKASAISTHFLMGVEPSIKVAMLGEKVNRALKTQGELTKADEAAYTDEALGIAGTSMVEIAAAAMDPIAEKALRIKVAEKLGTTPANLRASILKQFGYN